MKWELQLFYILSDSPTLGIDSLFLRISLWNAGMLIPWLGIELCPLHWEHGVLMTGPTRMSLVFLILRVSSGVSRRRQWHLTPVLLPGESHGRRSLEGCSPWGRWGSDTTERLHFHFSLSCIGEGHGNPLQCSCLENPRDGGAWWAAVYGVAQSRTPLKQLSSSSSGVSSLKSYFPDG